MSSNNYKLKRVADSTVIKLLPKMTIGRLEECELQLLAGGASRRHAVLTIETEDLWLEDLKSANGTFVNEQRLDGKIKLKAGDRVRIDVEEFLVEGLPSVEVAATVMKKFDPLDLEFAPEIVPEFKPELKAETNKPATKPENKTLAASVEEKSTPTINLPGAWASGDRTDNDVDGRTAYMARKDMQSELESPSAGRAHQIQVVVPTLLIHSGNHAGRRFEMHPDSTSRAEWSVGNDPGRSILLSDSGVSALHAVISVEGARWKLVDKMSANGTFVNGRSAPSIYLSSGDQISFGPVKCAFLAPIDEQPPEIPSAQGSEPAGTGKNKTLMIAVASFGITLLVVGVLLMLRK